MENNFTKDNLYNRLKEIEEKFGKIHRLYLNNSDSLEVCTFDPEIQKLFTEVDNNSEPYFFALYGEEINLPLPFDKLYIVFNNSNSFKSIVLMKDKTEIEL